MSLWSEIFKVETKMCNIKSQTETNISNNYDKKYENQILKFVDTNGACSFFNTEWFLLINSTVSIQKKIKKNELGNGIRDMKMEIHP